METQEEKSIFKTISLLSGVQSFNIIVGVIRNKAISILLGAYGMGWMSMFQSTSDIISSFSNLGITTSAVKDISCAHSNNDLHRIGYVISVFKKLVLLTGLIAFTICLVGSPILSILNFGDTTHIFDFALLAISLFLLQQVAGFTTLLQGCRQFKKMGLATLIGNVLGLIISLPLYYIGGVKAIVPVMIVAPMVNICVLWYFSSKLGIHYINVSFKESIKFGSEIIKTGFFICLQGLFALVYIYVLRLYLSRNGGLEYVGYFNAGMVIVNTYVGLVFSSMGTEYYPRLSTIHDEIRFKDSINRQMSRCVLILTPLICTMMVFMPLVIRILYTDSFSVINEMCLFLLASVGFKIIEWCLGFAFLAQGRTKVLFCNEVTFKVYTLLLSLFLYNRYGLVGIGYAYLLSELMFCAQSLLIANKIWKFSINKSSQITLVVSILLILICLLFLYMDLRLKYVVCGICIVCVTISFLRYIRKIK